MNKDEFKALFERMIEESIQMAEEYHQTNLPRNIRIRLHNKGGAARVVYLDVENTLSRLYFDEHRFQWIIDIGVFGVSLKNNYTLIWVIPSGHAPSGFENTLNYHLGQGPFKKIISSDLKILDEA